MNTHFHHESRRSPREILVFFSLLSPTRPLSWCGKIKSVPPPWMSSMLVSWEVDERWLIHYLQQSKMRRIPFPSCHCSIFTSLKPLYWQLLVLQASIDWQKNTSPPRLQVTAIPYNLLNHGLDLFHVIGDTMLVGGRKAREISHLL